VFTQKQVFGTRTAKSQPIWIKFCTHLLLYGIQWTDLDRDRRVGGTRHGSPRFRRQTVKVEVRTSAIVKNSGIL